jgi:hypothetical protein
MTTFTSLPSDIVVEFLWRLDSLEDTLATISTAKYVYEIFKAHPSHILRGVICHMLHMDEAVFPVAFGLILQVESARPSDSSMTPRKGLMSSEDLSATLVTRTRLERLRKQHHHTLLLERDFSRLYVAKVKRY